MSYAWGKSAARAQRLIARFGAPCQVLAAASAPVPGAPAGKPWDSRKPSGGASQPAGAGVPSVAVRTRFATRDVDGVNVRMSDALLLLDPRVEPQEGGSVVFDGSTYRVIATQPVSPAGVVLLYRVQGRA